MNRERPILFSGPMVRAILEGRKTQTRRVIKPQPGAHLGELPGPAWNAGYVDVKCPYGDRGDRLWVRETHCIEPGTTAENWDRESGDEVMYRADGDVTWAGEGGALWRPSIFMPRWASRITLEVASVRVERIQDISEDDAKAEGVEPAIAQESWSCMDADGRTFETFGEPDQAMREEDGLVAVIHQPERVILDARGVFRNLWDSINGKRPGCSWADNPWVFVVSFKRLDDASARRSA